MSGDPSLLQIPFIFIFICISLDLCSKYPNRNTEYTASSYCENIIAVPQDRMHCGDLWQKANTYDLKIKIFSKNF